REILSLEEIAVITKQIQDVIAEINKIKTAIEKLKTTAGEVFDTPTQQLQFLKQVETLESSVAYYDHLISLELYEISKQSIARCNITYDKAQSYKQNRNKMTNLKPPKKSISSNTIPKKKALEIVKAFMDFNFEYDPNEHLQ